MKATLSDEAVQALLRLFPTAAGRPDAAQYLVEQLSLAEAHRRGGLDAVSGAYHALALTQGNLLKEEYDYSSHGHADGWTLGAWVVDPRALTLVNMHHGFPVGDAVLKAIVRGCQAALPTAKVVRVHTDGFAALLGPTASLEVRPEQGPALHTQLEREVKAALPEGAATPLFTLGALEVTVVDPPTWQVLGPLVWAECERALVIHRRLRGGEVLRRRLVLDGRLPPLPEP